MGNNNKSLRPMFVFFQLLLVFSWHLPIRYFQKGRISLFILFKKVQLVGKYFWKIILADYLFQVLNSTVNTQAMPKRIVGPGAMKMGVKGEYVSDFSIAWPKLRNVTCTSCLPLLLFNFLLQFSITGSLVIKIVLPSLYTKEKNREIKAKSLSQEQEGQSSQQFLTSLLPS